MTAAWVGRVERAMRRVMPADGQWHRINVTPFVHTGTGAVRLQFSCRAAKRHRRADRGRNGRGDPDGRPARRRAHGARVMILPPPPRAGAYGVIYADPPWHTNHLVR